MKIVKSNRFKPGDAVLIPGDLHFPKHNQKALDLCIKAAKGFGCNKVMLQGDNLDSAHISRHGYSRGESFREDNDCIAAFTAQVKKAGIQPTVAGLGNHDGSWFEEYAATHPGLSHEDLLPALYDNWEVLPAGYVLALNKKLVVTHGDALNGSCATNPAASVLRNYPGLNVIFGHCHRQDIARTIRPTHDGPRTTVAVAVGCLVSQDYELSNRALRVNAQRHALGFGVAVLHKNDLFEVLLGSIMETKQGMVCLLAGELYK